MCLKATLNNAQVFIKTLTPKKILNGFLLRLSYHASKLSGVYIHWGKPESLSLEPTNLCNLKCPECPSGNNAMTRPRLFLAENDFKSVIDQTYRHLAYLQLFFQGEPFLHPKLFNFAGYASLKNIYTVTSTNGQFLTPENCIKTVKSGLHRIIISIDGATQQVYEKYRVGGSLERAVNGIANLVKAKKELKSKVPMVVMQFVVFSTNEHQLPDIKKLAVKLGVDKLEIKTAQIGGFIKGNRLIPSKPEYSRYAKGLNGEYYLKRNTGFKCKRIWLGGVITASNKLLPCCFDKNAEHAYNTSKPGLVLGAWKADEAKKFRIAVWNGYNKFDMCKNCTEGLKA